MQFNVVPRTGGLVINREKIEEKEGCDGIILTLCPQCMQGKTRTNGDRDFAMMKSVELGRGSETKQRGQKDGRSL